ncbi:hypothetical protein [Gracilimonas tropica]|uniref:hypothetical protein n=1 Tax=Gracilimonas tropica TaxID=454600 RepID=UPI00037AD711|nr:hypothetical protein [Gracilimonas tropica]
MKPTDRLAKLETEIFEPGTDAEKLIALGEKWLDAVHQRNWDTAIELAEQATTYFEDHPDWKEWPPEHAPKLLFIQWRWFSRFHHPEIRTLYQDAITQNKTPNLVPIN